MKFIVVFTVAWVLITLIHQQAKIDTLTKQLTTQPVKIAPHVCEVTCRISPKMTQSCIGTVVGA